jgi:hypothetical protein
MIGLRSLIQLINVSCETTDPMTNFPGCGTTCETDTFFSVFDDVGSMIVFLPKGRSPRGAQTPDVALERDPEKACPGRDPRWTPAFRKDHAPSKIQSAMMRSGS